MLKNHILPLLKAFQSHLLLLHGTVYKVFVIKLDGHHMLGHRLSIYSDMPANSLRSFNEVVLLLIMLDELRKLKGFQVFYHCLYFYS